MNMANNGAKYGVDQYRFALNFDLKDKSFVISADGKKFALSFAGLDQASLAVGNGVETFDYECLKLEKDTYFVCFGSNIAVLELKHKAATLVLPGGYVFGEIELTGQAPPDDHHSFTDGMTGTGVRWMLGCDKYMDRIYHSADKCRTAWSPKDGEFAVQPATYVSIKDGIYLVDVAGPTPGNTCAPPGCDRVVTLEDYERMLVVGCAYAGDDVILFSGFGAFPDFDQALFA